MTNPTQQPVQQKSWFLRHKILTALLAIAVIIVGVNIFGGGSSDTPSSTPTAGDAAGRGAAEPAQTPAEPGLGVPVRDGKFEFTVLSVDPPVPSVGSEYLTETAQGEFRVVKLTVRNVGDQAQSFSVSAQKLLDADGKQYSADDTATIYLDEGIGFEQINPGNALDASVVFDVPVGTAPAQIELHDSVFSGGVTVALN